MPQTVEALRHGYQYMSENGLDQLEPVIMPIRHAYALGDCLKQLNSVAFWTSLCKVAG